MKAPIACVRSSLLCATAARASPPSMPDFRDARTWILHCLDDLGRRDAECDRRGDAARGCSGVFVTDTMFTSGAKD